MVWWVHLQVIFHPKKSIHSTSSEQNHTYTIKQKLLDSPIMKQWERPHSYTVHFKEQMGQWREAVGQLPSQQPDQSCGTVATSTAWPKLWDSCHLNSLTKAVGQLPSQQPDQSCGTVAISTARPKPDQSCRTVAISTAWPKLWDSCHLNSLTKAVGQLPSQQPDQSCGTVATSTAQKLWDSCHLNSPTKAVGQLPPQQPDQSCGTVAISTAQPKLWDSCHFNSLTKEIWTQKKAGHSTWKSVKRFQAQIPVWRWCLRPVWYSQHTYRRTCHSPTRSFAAEYPAEQKKQTVLECGWSWFLSSRDIGSFTRLALCVYGVGLDMAISILKAKSLRSKDFDMFYILIK